jgi:DNA polymerase III delta prime subunit
MSITAAIAAITGLIGKAIEPITNLVDDERFTPQERAELKSSQLLAEIANERTRLEIERMELQIEVERQQRLATEAKASADAQSALALIQQAQTKEDDLYTKRLRPTVGYLMTLMLLADQAWTMAGHERFFNLALYSGYFGLLGIYIGGRSLEKVKRCRAASAFVGPPAPQKTKD